MSTPVNGYLLLDRLSIAYANAISSPLTYGFPAISAFLGAVHALQRRLQTQEALSDFMLHGVAVACHDYQLLSHQTERYQPATFNQQRLPVLRNGKTASIIEEGKMHLTVSLVVAVKSEYNPSDQQREALTTFIKHRLWQQHIAGGSLLGDPIENQWGEAVPARVEYIPASQAEGLLKRLLPAYILMDARRELKEIMQTLRQENPDATTLDGLLEACTLHHIPEEVSGKTAWRVRSVKQGRGWLVPIPVGYQSIAPAFEPGALDNVRHPDYPAHYVEALYSLGKWVFPHRIQHIDDALWHYQYDADHSRYLIVQSTH